VVSCAAAGEARTQSRKSRRFLIGVSGRSVERPPTGTV
jgi:hypothetical protein